MVRGDRYDFFSMIFDDVVLKEKYLRWEEFILRVWYNHDWSPDSLLDLACGTGNNLEIYAKRGIFVYGVDKSVKMLKKAAEKKISGKYQLLESSFSDFRINTLVDAAICLDFSTNYILSASEFVRFLDRVYAYLASGGIFVFDFKPTKAFPAKNLIKKVGRYEFNCIFDISNSPLVNAQITVSDLEAGIVYKELHEERGYDIEEIQTIVERSKFKNCKMYDNCKIRDPSPDCELIQVVVRKEF